MNLGKKYIWLTQREVDDLPEYSSSYPTGTTIGKRWKRQLNDGTWLICEYVKHQTDPNSVLIIGTALMLVNHRK
jgi:hypothetical protein